MNQKIYGPVVAPVALLALVAVQGDLAAEPRSVKNAISHQFKETT